MRRLVEVLRETGRTSRTAVRWDGRTEAAITENRGESPPQNDGEKSQDRFRPLVSTLQALEVVGSSSVYDPAAYRSCEFIVTLGTGGNRHTRR
jgi:hypothetical protein